MREEEPEKGEKVYRKTDRWKELGFGDDVEFPGYGKIYKREFNVWYVDVGSKEKKGETTLKDHRVLQYEPIPLEVQRITGSNFIIDERERTEGYKSLFTGLDQKNRKRWYFGLKEAEPTGIETFSAYDNPESGEYEDIAQPASQTPVEKNVFPEKKSINPKFIKGCGCAGLFIVVVIFGLIFLSGYEENTVPDKREFSKNEALTMSQLFVKDQLISPASAEFGYGEDQVFQKNDSTFIIESYVDSQNSFGAMLRSRYVCTLYFDQNEVGHLIDLTME